jgi:hypothetical protein
MTTNEARPHAIHDFIYIEGRIDDILVREIQPPAERRRFVNDISPETTIMPTSSKFKLIRHVIQLSNWPSTNESSPSSLPANSQAVRQCFSKDSALHAL